MTYEKTLRRVSALAIAVVGVIHLVLAKEYLEEQAYLGALFIAGGVGALIVALRLWFAPDRLAWSVGVLIAAGMFVGFILSRTTGLPGFKESEWELSGIVSLILEAGFMGAAALTRTSAAARPRRSSPARATTRTRPGSPATPHA
jgi:hypothetical protein